MKQFRNTTDQVLLEELKILLKKEKELVIQVLHLLLEVEVRKLYLTRGFSSLFKFCVEYLGYSDSEAMTRIQAIGVEKTKVLKNENTLIQFIANSALMEKLEKLQGLLAHKNFSGRYDLLFSELADIALKKLDPCHDQSSVKKEKAPDHDAGAPRAPAVKQTSENKAQAQARSRYISAETRRKVWLRAQGCCQYQDPLTGKRCGSKYALELDHIAPFAEGGTHDENNLQLLCDGHNRLRARPRFTEIEAWVRD